MTFSGQKYYSKPVNNGNVDKDEPGKKPKPTYKKMEDNPASVDKKPRPTKEQAEANLQKAKNVSDIHPVTGRTMTDAEKVKMAREKKYRKQAGYGS